MARFTVAGSLLAHQLPEALTALVASSFTTCVSPLSPKLLPLTVTEVRFDLDSQANVVVADRIALDGDPRRR